MAPREQNKIDDEIDRNLRRAFEELASEPLPDRFAELIARLRAGTPSGAKPDDDASGG